VRRTAYPHADSHADARAFTHLDSADRYTCAPDKHTDARGIAHTGIADGDTYTTHAHPGPNGVWSHCRTKTNFAPGLATDGDNCDAHNYRWRASFIAR